MLCISIRRAESMAYVYIMKYLKIGTHELVALALIIVATGLRLILITQNWPISNSDEATMGIMARHIAYRGELPIFFYGQYYMGSLEAFIGAAFFHLSGSSVFSLRLGLVLMFTLFLISIYLLTSLLYSKAWALVSVALLSIGSSYMVARQLSAIGGYPETLLFGSLAFLCAAWLVLAYQPEIGARRSRLLMYACWGLVVGLGLWSDLLIIPFVMMSGLLLLAFCWRELLRIRAVLFILLGLLIGAAPLIYYNITAAPGQDSLTTLWHLQHGGSAPLHFSRVVLTKELLGTIQVSIPMMTGNPFCPVTELPFLGPTSPHTLTCTIAHSTWGLGYLLLFAVAIALTGWAVGQCWRRVREKGRLQGSSEERRALVLHSTRLALLGSALLALAFYAFSAAPIDWPGIHARYIIGLLIATPAIFWPLWYGVSKSEAKMTALLRLRKGICTALLLCIGVVLLIGTGMMLGEIPAAQAANQRQQALIDHLLSIGATHIYTDYWTCDRIAFVSQEKIICGVIDGNLQPSHNRDSRYYDSVSADPHSAYVFAADGQIQAVLEKVTQPGAHYRRYDFEGYIIYQPE